MDCSLTGSSVHGILQTRILEWVVIPFSRGSSRPRDWTWVSCMQVDSLPSEPPGKPMDVGNLFSCSSAFSKPRFYNWQFLVQILLKCSLKDSEHYFASMWNKCYCTPFEHSLALPFFGIEMKTDLFQSYGHCWVFQICWHIEYSTLTASCFRILNSLAGILSLFVFKNQGNTVHKMTLTKTLELFVVNISFQLDSLIYHQCLISVLYLLWKRGAKSSIGSYSPIFRCIVKWSHRHQFTGKLINFSSPFPWASVNVLGRALVICSYGQIYF